MHITIEHKSGKITTYGPDGARIRASQYDAENVVEHLERAKRAAQPLKDHGLVKKIDDAKRHVEEKLDPKKG